MSQPQKLVHEIHHRLVGAGVFLLALTFFGCGRGEDRPSANDSTLTVLYPIDEYGLGPAWSAQSMFLVFSPLVARNEQGELEGRLARSWEHSPDYREWTVWLRSDIAWHDGVPFTARDVKFTLDLLSRPETGWAARGAYSVSVLDDTTYRMTSTGTPTRSAIGNPLDDYTVFYPKHLLEGLDPAQFYEWEFWKQPVGTGPYRYVRTIPHTMIELEANPAYFRGKPAHKTGSAQVWPSVAAGATERSRGRDALRERPGCPQGERGRALQGLPLVQRT